MLGESPCHNNIVSATQQGSFSSQFLFFLRPPPPYPHFLTQSVILMTIQPCSHYNIS